MTPGLIRLPSAALLAALVCLGMARHSPAAAQDAPDVEDAEAASRAQRLDELKRAAAEYELSLDSDREHPLEFRPEPILRWSNPIRKTGDGAVFLWTRRGRPQAAVCIYTYGPSGIDHEFQSLADGPLEARRDGDVVWTPREAGLDWKPLPAAPAPAPSPAVRLSQMRTLARAFAASIVQGDEGSALRLMTQPVSRYGATGTAVLDGAVFAFVQGTDPEVLLLLEAVDDGKQPRWQYAAARMSSAPLEVKHGDEVVYTVPRWNWQPVPTETYITFVRQREERP